MLSFKKKHMILGVLMLLFASCVFAGTTATQYHGGVGDIAKNVFGVGLDVREMIRTVCIIAGSVLLLFSLIQYKKHRDNPVEVSLGSVFFTLITGASLILLSFVPMQI